MTLCIVGELIQKVSDHSFFFKVSSQVRSVTYQDRPYISQFEYFCMWGYPQGLSRFFKLKFYGSSEMILRYSSSSNTLSDRSNAEKREKTQVTGEISVGDQD
jgi:hypothetical protein